MKLYGQRNTSYSDNFTYRHTTSSLNNGNLSLEEDSDGFFFGIDSVTSANKKLRAMKLPSSAFLGKYDHKRNPNF